MKVAVYGTLRKGFGNHRLLENSEFLGKTKTAPRYSMYGHIVPWVSNGGTTAITVEVYEVDDRTMQSLDWLEGYPNYYDRQLITTEFGQAWIYFIDNRTTGNKIENGDWAEYRRSVLL